jgi:hypothetical protein
MARDLRNARGIPQPVSGRLLSNAAAIKRVHGAVAGYRRQERLLMNASHRIKFQPKDGERYVSLVAVDGKLDLDSSGRKIGDGAWSVRVQSQDIAQELCAMPLEELRSIFESLKLPIRSAPHEYLSHATVLFSDRAKLVVNRVEYSLNVDFTGWSMPWTIETLYEELEKVARESSVPGLQIRSDLYGLGRTISCVFADGATTTGEQLANWNPIVAKFVELAVSEASKRISRDAVVAFFKFPPDVSTACQQYLLYFIQFLRDLGIDATADIHEEAHRVLFMVTPETGREALEQVQEALTIYLSLPTRSDLQTAAAGDDVAIAQLRANVLHLRSQLALAAAVVRTKDAQIEALELSNYQYRQLLALPSTDSPKGGEDQDSIEVMGGMVKVVPYKGKGFELNLPALLRKLVRR